MKFKNPVLVVEDLERSKTFYREVLGLHVILDFGANVTLTGGICLQTRDSWLRLIQGEQTDVSFGGRDAELYFEEDDLEGFLERLQQNDTVHTVHPPVEHPWGQRVVRFYDPDRHIIEVGETMGMVCRRFLRQGMTAQQIAQRMDVPLKYGIRCVKAGERRGLQ